MDITGKIIKVFPTETFDSGFQKTEFVIEYADNPEYPQTILFQLTGRNHDLLTRFKWGVGHEVKVSFNIRGRKWVAPDGKERYFNSLDAWRVDAAESATESPSETLYKPKHDPIPEVETVAEDDLPF